MITISRAAAVFAIVCALASPAVADVPACAGLTAEARAIDEALAADARRAPRWTWWWSIGYVIAGTGSMAVGLAAPDDWIADDTRAGLYVTTVKAYVGGVLRVILAPRISEAATCGDDRRALLVKAARKERNTAILGVVGGLALNTAGLLYLGLRRDDWRTGWISFASGTVVGAVTLWTIPRRSWSLRRRLDRAATIGVAPMVPVGEHGFGGLSLVGTW